MVKKKISICENQISIFDLLREASETPKKAVSMLDGRKHDVYPLMPWMERILPQGAYYIISDKYNLVLCKSTDKAVPSDMLYRHFKIGDAIYAAVGVGIIDGYEDEGEEDCDFCADE